MEGENAEINNCENLAKKQEKNIIKKLTNKIVFSNFDGAKRNIKEKNTHK